MYAQKVEELLSSEGYDPQKHQQMVDALGRPPNFINMIFYDEELPIQKLLQTTYNAMEIDAFRNVPLVFSSHIIDGTLQITAIQGDNF